MAGIFEILTFYGNISIVPGLFDPEILHGPCRAFNKWGFCMFQVLDPTVAWILSSVGPTIRRSRGYPLYDCGHPYSWTTCDQQRHCPVTSNHCPKECEACASHTHSLLSIIVDGRSRRIVRTDPIPKPGVSSTLLSKKREML